MRMDMIVIDIMTRIAMKLLDKNIYSGRLLG